MGERWQKIKKLFTDLWCNNIKTHYKSISAALAVFIVSTFGIFTTQLAGIVGPVFAGIFYALDFSASYICFKVMGKIENGNGKDIPSTKELLTLFKEDKDFRKLAYEKLAKKYIENGNNIKTENEKTNIARTENLRS